MCGQLLRSAQETGVEKALSLPSDQQTPNEHSPELNMNHENSLCGSDGVEFSRLTERLVFAFLGGYVSMDYLPCLGDLVNGIDGFHRTTSISMNSYSESSQVESLDLSGNLLQLSAISMDLNFISRIMDYHCESVKNSECYQKPVENVSILLDTFDASSTACSPPEHTSQSIDEIESLPKSSTDAHFICNNSAIDILDLDHPTPSMPFQQCDFTGNFVMSTIAFGLSTDSLDSNSAPDTLFKKLAFKLQKIGVNRITEIQEDALINHHHESNSGNFESQFHRHHKNLNGVPVFNFFLTFASKNRPINDGNTFAIPNSGTLMDYLYGDLEILQFPDAESSSMQSEDLCCTIGINGEGPTYSVPDPSKLMNLLYGDLESLVFLSSESIEEVVPIYAEYGNDSKVEVISRSADHTIEESPQCSAVQSLTVPETIVGFMTESLRDSNGFTNGMDFNTVRISSNSKNDKENSKVSDSKLSYHQDDFNVVDHKPKKQFPKNLTNFVPTPSLFSHKCEDDKENMKTDPSPFISNNNGPSLMDQCSTRNFYENPEIYVSSTSCDQKVCLLGDYGSDDDVEVTELSGCMHSRLFCSYENIFNTKSLPIESKNGSLAGAFEGNEITPTSSALLECNGEKIGAESSFFSFSDHDDLLKMYVISNQKQNTDTEYACESPTWPGKSGGQTQRPLTCLIPNLTEDDNANGLLTADASLVHSNTDEIAAMNKKLTGKIYEENSGNSVSLCQLNQMECAFETSSLRSDASSINCVHSRSDSFEDSIKHQSLKNDFKFAFPDPSALKDYFFGSLDSPKFLSSELLDGNIDNLHYLSLFGDNEQNDRTEEADLSDKMIFDQCVYDVIQLFDVTSYPFDISDHDKLLEWYDINDQDQFPDGNWTCDSPTWPGKI